MPNPLFSPRQNVCQAYLGQHIWDEECRNTGEPLRQRDIAMPLPCPALPLALAATAFTREQLICPQAPQIALAGRSNVGKSSLINALAGRKGLAKTSAVPGKTRSINYYRLDPEMRFLVDLPGYGYARCGQAERLSWTNLLDVYFRNTPGLNALLLLLDARLPPQASDRKMAAFAGSLGLRLVPVLTKTDKCARRELAQTLRSWRTVTGERDPLCVSAKDKTGVELLRQRICCLLCRQ